MNKRIHFNLSHYLQKADIQLLIIQNANSKLNKPNICDNYTNLLKKFRIKI